MSGPRTFLLDIPTGSPESRVQTHRLMLVLVLYILRMTYSEYNHVLLVLLGV